MNNVLTPDQIEKSSFSTEVNANVMSGITPQSTTAELAGKVPKESSNRDPEPSRSSNLPGEFPETPAGEPAGFSVNPIPATSGIGNPINLRPGEPVPDLSTFTSNTVSSTVRDDPSLAANVEDPQQQAFKVNPLPATSGAGNPIQLQPGEKVPPPESFTANTIDSTLTTDKKSYETRGSAPQLPNVVTPQEERNASGAGLFTLPGISGNMIPESSLPLGTGSSSNPDPGVTIQSVGPNSTTAGLAGQVPLEPRGVPEVISKSQLPGVEGNRDNRVAQDEASVNKDLGNKVSNDLLTTKQAKPDPSSGGTKSSAPNETATATADPGLNETPGSKPTHALGLPASVQQSIDEINKGTPIAPNVPDTVQESIAKQNVSPEAAESKALVDKKHTVEAELLSATKNRIAPEESAPSSSVAQSETDPNATSSASGEKPTEIAAPKSTLSASKGEVTDSSSKQGTPGNASTATNATSTGRDTISSSTNTQPSTKTSTDQSSTLPIPGSALGPRSSSLAEAVRNREDSRDISPMSHPVKNPQGSPSVTTGVGTSSTPQTSRPTAATSEPSASSDKKSKRASGFFGKLRSKFHDKDKKSGA